MNNLSPALSAFKVAEGAEAAARALVDDARNSKLALEAALDAFEAEFRAAEIREAEAIAASAAKRDDRGLADDVSRAGVRRLHAKADFDRAEKAVAVGASDLIKAQEHALNAAGALTLAAKLVELHEGEIDRKIIANATDVARHMIAAHKGLLTHYDLLSESAALVAEIHASGGSGHIQPADGVTAAGAFAAVVHDAGGALGDPNISRWRWPWARPPVGRRERIASASLAQLVDLIAVALETGANDERRGVAWRRAALAEHADVFTRHRTIAEANAELNRNHTARAEDEANAVADAHERRLVGERAIKAAAKGRSTYENGGKRGFVDELLPKSTSPGGNGVPLFADDYEVKEG